MTKIIAKLEMKDSNNNPSILLVKVLDDQSLSYSLSGAVSRIAFSIGNMNVKIPLPLLMLDYDNVNDVIVDVQKAIRTGTGTITNVKKYS